MMKQFKHTGIWLLVLLAGLTACKKDQSMESLSRGDLLLNFHPVVDNAPLDFTSKFFNGNGEDYTIKSFKFYIHKIELINEANGQGTPVSAEHYLLDAADPTSLTLHLKAMTKNYSGIAFYIGVDSIRNVSGAQVGALDPTKGMFWTWNSGYIMAKFEGVSSFSPETDKRFEYHIGGFKGQDNVVKRIVLDFAPAEDLRIIQGKTASVNISANANSWFNATTDLYIAVNPVSMTPGPLSKSIAENYYSMFTVLDVENN